MKTLEQRIYSLPLSEIVTVKKNLYDMQDELKLWLEDKEIEEDLVNYAMDKSVHLAEEKVSAAIVERETRVDGRKLDEIRPLSCEVDVLNSGKPVYVSNDNKQEFYIRASASSQPLNMKDSNEYIKTHWANM